jgi:hypothetical protein
MLKRTVEINDAAVRIVATSIGHYDPETDDLEAVVKGALLTAHAVQQPFGPLKVNGTDITERAKH